MKPKLALKDVSFSVEPGQVYGFIGPNGAGKSTTIKVLTGLLNFDSGKVLVNGISPRDVKSRRFIGYSPEQPYFYDYLTGRELLKFYGKLADMDKPGIAAINTLFAQDGFLLYVPDGVVLEKPLQLITLLSSKVDLMVNRRILVVLGRSAQAKLLLCDHALAANQYLTTQVVEVFAGRNSSFELYDLEETHYANKRTSELYVSQEADSNVEIDYVTLHNGQTRNTVFSTFAGRGSNLSLNGIATIDKEQHVDNMTFVDHRVSDCTSNELFKYVLDDSASGAFAGKVLVRHGAQHTESQQTNRNICLTRQARMFTQPQLEIYADDVKCSHGATVGQLDDKAMFYMRQRGIPEAEARMMLMQAFVGEVIGRVSLEPLRDRLNRLVEKRFRGELTQCEGCRACR